MFKFIALQICAAGFLVAGILFHDFHINRCWEVIFFASAFLCVAVSLGMIYHRVSRTHLLLKDLVRALIKNKPY